MDLEQFENILCKYLKWSYTVDYEIPEWMKEEKKSEEKVEEETPKTQEIVEQPETESTTDASSEDSTSWTHKVSGFFKQLFNKK